MGFSSIYNLYNRKNAASINFRRNDDTGNNEAIKLLFSMVPQLVTILNFKTPEIKKTIT
jgi:hypothetical protein